MEVSWYERNNSKLLLLQLLFQPKYLEAYYNGPYENRSDFLEV